MNPIVNSEMQVHAISGDSGGVSYNAGLAAGLLPLAERPVTRLREREMRLLPMLHGIDLLSPATAVLGRTRTGLPVLLNFHSQSGHLLITGPRRSGKSEMIRSALLSLCLTSRRAQVCVMGIDIGGHELAVLESMPHALTELATEPTYAKALLLWLEEERIRRKTYTIQHPALVLVIDNLAWLDRPARRAEAQILAGLMTLGGISGIHVVASSLDPLPVRFHSLLENDSVVHATTFDQFGGVFTLRSGKEKIRATAAWSSAMDLNTAASLAQAGWLESQRCIAGATSV